MRSLFTLFALFTLSIAALAKDHVWQTGKLLDTERNAYFAGTVGSGSTSGTVSATGSTYGNMTTVNGRSQQSTSSSTDAIYHVWQYFVIEGDREVYQGAERIRWKWSKPADLAVNGSVRYAVEGRKLIVLDDQGKQHSMEIVKRTLKNQNLFLSWTNPNATQEQFMKDRYGCLQQASQGGATICQAGTFKACLGARGYVSDPQGSLRTPENMTTLCR